LSNKEIEVHLWVTLFYSVFGGIMTITEMLGQSGLLTLLGMGVVFLFLIIMILAMYLLHAILHGLHLDKVEKKDDTSSVSTAAPADNSAVVAAIATAVHEKESV
jgi:oxaloacetate decarboxylase gamma subunit